MNLVDSYTNIRNNLKKSFDKVTKAHEPMLVTRRNGENVVIISQDDFEALEETAYLLKSPKMTKRLLEALNRKTEIKFNEVKKRIGI